MLWGFSGEFMYKFTDESNGERIMISVQRNSTKNCIPLKSATSREPSEPTWLSPQTVSRSVHRFFCTAHPCVQHTYRQSYTQTTLLEAGRSANTNCYWRQRFRCLLRCHLELVTYRSVSLVTVCGDVCQTPEGLRVSSPELLHLRTVYFALYRCTHYYWPT